MDFRLKVFETVAKLRSFTRAAEELNISQPAISKHIRELETQFQIALFERVSGSNVRITEEGELLLRHSNKILDSYRQMEYEMNLLSSNFSGELKIGASSTISQYVIPPLLANFIKKFPNIKLSLISGNSLQIEQALLEKTINLGLIEGLGGKPNFHYDLFLKDELVAITSSSSVYSNYDEISLEQFRKAPLVLRENGSGTLEVIKTELSRRDVNFSDLRILMQLGSTESIKLFLDNTESVGIVSIRSVSKDIFNNRFKVIDIKDVSFVREFQFIRNYGKNGGIEEQFIQFAKMELKTNK